MSTLQVRHYITFYIALLNFGGKKTPQYKAVYYDVTWFNFFQTKKEIIFNYMISFLNFWNRSFIANNYELLVSYSFNFEKTKLISSKLLHNDYYEISCKK